MRRAILSLSLALALAVLPAAPLSAQTYQPVFATPGATCGYATGVPAFPDHSTVAAVETDAGFLYLAPAPGESKSVALTLAPALGFAGGESFGGGGGYFYRPAVWTVDVAAGTSAIVPLDLPDAGWFGWGGVSSVADDGTAHGYTMTLGWFGFQFQTWRWNPDGSRVPE